MVIFWPKSTLSAPLVRLTSCLHYLAAHIGRPVAPGGPFTLPESPEAKDEKETALGEWIGKNIFKIIGDRWLALSRIFHQFIVPSWHPHFFAHMPSPYTKAPPWNARAPRYMQMPTVTWIGAYLGHPQKMSQNQRFTTILAIKFTGWVIDLAYTSTCWANNLSRFWVVDFLSSSIVDIGFFRIVSHFWIKGGCGWPLFLRRVWVDSRARFLSSSCMWVIGLRLVLDFARCTTFWWGCICNFEVWTCSVLLYLYHVHCFLVIRPCQILVHNEILRLVQLTCECLMLKWFDGMVTNDSAI